MSGKTVDKPMREYINDKYDFFIGIGALQELIHLYEDLHNKYKALQSSDHSFQVLKHIQDILSQDKDNEIQETQRQLILQQEEAKLAIEYEHIKADLDRQQIDAKILEEEKVLQHQEEMIKKRLDYEDKLLQKR